MKENNQQYIKFILFLIIFLLFLVLVARQMDEQEENIIKAKHLEVLGILKGLSVAQAKLVLDIVIEDFSANAVIQSN